MQTTKRTKGFIVILIAACLLFTTLACCMNPGVTPVTPDGSIAPEPVESAGKPFRNPTIISHYSTFYQYNAREFLRTPNNNPDYKNSENPDVLNNMYCTVRPRIDRVLHLYGSAIAAKGGAYDPALFMGFSIAPDGKTIYLTNNATSSVEVFDLNGAKKASYKYEGHEEGFDIIACGDRYMVIGNLHASLCVYSYNLQGKLLSRQTLSTYPGAAETARFYTFGNHYIYIMRDDGLFSNTVADHISQVAPLEARIYKYDYAKQSFVSTSGWASAEIGDMAVNAWLDDHSMTWSADLSAYGLNAFPQSYDRLMNIYIRCVRTNYTGKNDLVVVKMDDLGAIEWMLDCTELMENQNVLELVQFEDYNFYLDYGVEGEVHAVFTTPEGITVYTIY